MPSDAPTAATRSRRDIPHRREDRRTRRTRSALQHALVELALERGYAPLTIEEIAEQADVGRATFYTHYRDKDELLESVVQTLLDELRDLLVTELDDETGFTGRPVHILFRHAAQRSDSYRLILRGDGDGRALLALTDALSRATRSVFSRRIEAHGVTPRIDLDLLAHAWVGEQLAVLTWWFSEPDPPMPLDDAAGMLSDLSRHGRWWASGFDGAPPAGNGAPPE